MAIPRVTVPLYNDPMSKAAKTQSPYWFLVYVESGNLICSSQDLAYLEALALTIDKPTKIVR